MDAMRYRPNPHAAGLARGTSRTIGVVVPRLDRWYFSAVTAAVLSALKDSGHDILVHSADDLAESRSYLDGTAPFDDRFDGLILVNVHVDQRQARALRDGGVRVVSIGQATGVFPSITIDDAGAARTVIEHLVSLGHRRIGLVAVSSPTDRVLVASRDRRAAFFATMTANDLAVDESLVVPATSAIDAGIVAGRRLLDRVAPPTAVFALSDELALGVLRAAHELGLDVPGDLSVVGFDDHPAALAAGLSTVRQPVGDLGRLAALLLLGGPAIAGPAGASVVGEVGAGDPTGRPTDLLAPVTFVARDSTGPAPSPG